MALVTCPDCQAQISDAAPACPKCGRPMRMAPTPAQAPGPAPVAVHNVVTTRPETSVVTWGCLIFVLMALVCAVGGALSK